MFEMITNRGTNVATLGTMSVTMTAPNRIFLPAKSIFARAYPTMEQNTMFPRTVITATTMLLVK